MQNKLPIPDYDSVIVRYGEIFLKSEAVRRIFTRKLVHNVRMVLAREGIECEVIPKRLGLVIKTKQPEEAALRASNVFGVTSTSPAIETQDTLDAIKKASMKLAEYMIDSGTSFAVRSAKVAGKDYSRRDVEVEVGDIIRTKKGANVNLTHPDETIYVEVQKNKAYVFNGKTPGVGGLPYATQGRLLALITDERSMLAAWMMMRRGCGILPAYARENKETASYHETLEYFAPDKMRYITVQQNDPELIEETVLREECLGTVSDGKPEYARKTKAPDYIPLAGLTEKQVKEKLQYLRSTVKY